MRVLTKRACYLDMNVRREDVQEHIRPHIPDTMSVHSFSCIILSYVVRIFPKMCVLQHLAAYL